MQSIRVLLVVNFIICSVECTVTKEAMLTSRVATYAKSYKIKRENSEAYFFLLTTIYDMLVF